MTLLQKIGLVLLWQAVVGAVSVGMGLAVVVSSTFTIMLVSVLSGSEFSWSVSLVLLSVVAVPTWVALTVITAPEMFGHFSNKKGE